MKKRIVFHPLPLTLAAIFLPASFLFAQTPTPDNTITLTTYYPAPFGAYKKMTISDSVGIGTTSPAAKLHVSAPTGPQSIYLTTENNDGTSGLALWFANNYADSFNKNWVGLGQDNTDNSLRFSTTGSGSFSDATMTITTNGNVGIGTMGPNARLDVKGAGNTGDTYGFGVRNSDDVYAVAVIDNGNVGIGVMSPGAKLEVAGQVKITGGSPGAGKVLTSDASGLGSWQAPSGSAGPAEVGAWWTEEPISFMRSSGYYYSQQDCVGTDLGWPATHEVWTNPAEIVTFDPVNYRSRKDEDEGPCYNETGTIERRGVCAAGWQKRCVPSAFGMPLTCSCMR